MQSFISENNLIGIKNFLSGSETSMFVYKYLASLKRGEEILSVRESCNDLDPLLVLANFFPSKLSKYLSKFFNEEFSSTEVKGFDVVYDANKASAQEVIGDWKGHVGIFSLSRAVQILIDNKDNVMVDPQDIVILPPDSSISFGKDENETMSPILVAYITKK